MKTIEVVAAIIMKGDKILCTQRNFSKYDYVSYKYEFPGGKIEENEAEEAALQREIKEELDLEIVISEKFLTVEHDYPDFRLVMHSYLCKADAQEVTLTEHVNYKWLGVEDLETLDWAAADIPIVEKLRRDNDGDYSRLNSFTNNRIC